MCPSIECPNCLEKTYHRGTCENSSCSYDPLAGNLRVPDVDVWGSVPDDARVETYVQYSPFIMVRFWSSEEENVQRFAEHIGYKGSFFTKEDAMFFDVMTIHGFDLVRLNADRAIATLNYLVAQQPA